jgi:hypothetical protein
MWLIIVAIDIEAIEMYFSPFVKYILCKHVIAGKFQTEIGKSWAAEVNARRTKTCGQ